MRRRRPALSFAAACAALVAIALLTVLPAGPAAANLEPTDEPTSAATTFAPGTKAPGCKTFTWTHDAGYPIAEAPDQAVVDGGSIRLAGNADIADAYFSFQVAYGPLKTKARNYADHILLRWSMDGGAWHTIALDTFYPPRDEAEGLVWLTEPVDLPAMKAGSRHSFRILMAFKAGAPEGFYNVWPRFEARSSCYGSLGQGDLGIGYDPNLTHVGPASEHTNAPQTTRPSTPTPTTSPRTPASTPAPSAEPTTPTAIASSRRSVGGSTLVWVGGAALVCALAGREALRWARVRRDAP
jgi:hypothetical protein